jgi:hypothetical protein
MNTYIILIYEKCAKIRGVVVPEGIGSYKKLRYHSPPYTVSVFRVFLLLKI